MTEKPSIILPSETWAREFDAKLLLVCCLAERGYPVYVGCKNTIHLNITDFPAGLYMAKDFRVSSDTMFYILKKLGHDIVAWDEEATLPFDPDEYHAIRISPDSFEKVSAFYAWGQVNKETLECAPYPVPGPVHLTGNPRRDMSRPELRNYFGNDAEALREIVGLYAPIGDKALEKQLEGIISLSSRPIVRRLSDEVLSTAVRGIEIKMEFDESFFEGTGVYILGAVLETFFRRYVSINSFTETVLHTHQRGDIARWKARTGQGRII